MLAGRWWSVTALGPTQARATSRDNLVAVLVMAVVAAAAYI